MGIPLRRRDVAVTHDLLPNRFGFAELRPHLLQAGADFNPLSARVFADGRHYASS
jgi:hypothetical protein